MHTILYADDHILMATTEDELQTMAYQLNLIARKYKMTISSTKTKSMAMCGNHIQRVKIVLTRSLGRPKNRWENDVKSDITNVEITNWRDCIRNRLKWKEFVEKAKTSLKSYCLKKKNSGLHVSTLSSHLLERVETCSPEVAKI